MSLIYFSLTLAIFAYLAGLVGALTGLGGGVVLIPALVLLFHVDIHYAMGASLIGVIATSSGTAIAHMNEGEGGYTNLRIGLFLETGTVIGAVIGAMLVTIFPAAIISIIFGVVLILSAYFSMRRKEEIDEARPPHPWAITLKLSGSYLSKEGGYKFYQVQNVPLSLGIMTIAGVFSGLLGIGSGALKVLAMDQAMCLPYKVATTTSNFIIGITAAVSAGVYYSHGYIVPTIAFPVIVGVLLGAISGGRLLAIIPSQKLRLFFSIIILLLAIQMIYKGITGGL